MQNIGNLTRYDQDRECNCGQTCISGMCEYSDGEYLRYEDVKELLNTSTNSAMDAIALLEDLQNVICNGSIVDVRVHSEYMDRINAVLAQQHQ